MPCYRSEQNKLLLQIYINTIRYLFQLIDFCRPLGIDPSMSNELSYMIIKLSLWWVFYRHIIIL